MKYGTEELSGSVAATEGGCLVYERDCAGANAAGA